MLSFRVFAKLHSRRFLSPPPRDLCGRRLPRPCRGVGVHPEKIIRVGLVNRRTPAHSLIGRSLRTRRSRPCRDWLGVSPIPRRSYPTHSLTGRSLQTGLSVSSNASLLTFNRRSRPCRDRRLSTSSAPLPHIHKSLPTPALSPLSATLMGSPRMCCKQKTYSKAKPFRCNIYAKPGGGAFFPFWNSSNVTEHGSRITHRRPAPILSGSPVMRSSVKAILLLFLHKTYNLQLKTETSLRVQRLQLGIHQERIIELRHFTPALAQNRKEARRKRFVPFHG